MTEPHGPDLGHAGKGKLNPKILIGLAAVVVMLIVMRNRAGNAGQAGTAASSGTAPSTDGATLGDAEAAMMAQLQADNAQLITTQLALIPPGATGPRGKQGPPGKPGPPAPTHTVSKPITRKPNGGAGVPVTHGHFYTVRAGDTLSGIARASRLSNWRALLNGKTDKSVNAHPNLIRPGDKVWIPT